MGGLGLAEKQLDRPCAYGFISDKAKTALAQIKERKCQEGGENPALLDLAKMTRREGKAWEFEGGAVARSEPESTRAENPPNA